jgi:hypothetical protein
MVATNGADVPIVTRGAVIEFGALAGVTYRIDRNVVTRQEHFEPIEGSPAASPKQLGTVHIGLARTAQ